MSKVLQLGSARIAVRRGTLVAIFVALSGSLTAQEKKSISSPLVADRAAAIDAYLRPFAETNNFSGVVFLSQRDRVIYQKGYGKADPAFDVANTPQTRFHIASISKAFTAAAILLLEERGRLNTADPVSRFLPDYPNGTKISLEDLLRHTSGIPNVENQEDSRPYSAADIVALFKDKPLDFEPGSQARYTNSDYALLALIIENVAGQSYGDFLKANIFDVLRLDSTTHQGDVRRVIPYLAVGTEPDGLLGVRYTPFLGWSSTIGAGSLVSTGPDLCKFSHAVFSGGLLRPASVAKIMQPGGVFPYGWTDRDSFGHKGIGVGGRLRGFISDLEYFPDDDLCLAILTNSYSSVAQVVSADISAIALGQAATPPKINYLRPQPQELAAFTGQFQMPKNYYAPSASLTIQDRGDYLEATWSFGDTSVIYPTGGDDFVDRSNWAMVHFTRDAQRHVTGFNYNLLRVFVAQKLPAK